jgi:hypothetical protein
MNRWLAVISPRSISLQVPRSSLCWGHLLLFCRDGFCGRRDPGSFFQDFALVLHPPDLQLRIERTPAVRSRALSATSFAQVSCRGHRLDGNLCADQPTPSLFRLDPATGLLQPSTVVFASPPQRKTVLTLKLLAMLGLTRITYDKDGKTIVGHQSHAIHAHPGLQTDARGQAHHDDHVAAIPRQHHGVLCSIRNRVALVRRR